VFIGQYYVKMVSKICYRMGMYALGHGRTDRQTDGQHAISIPRYALVHRAVKSCLLCLWKPQINNNGLLTC